MGVCMHCQKEAQVSDPASFNLNNGKPLDDIDLSRQKILHQICEAKKRQARMEAQEARRLTDEARRLAEQANILELEAMRPLLEAQKLEQEARVLEAQMARAPGYVPPTMGKSAASIMKQTHNEM